MNKKIISIIFLLIIVISITLIYTYYNNSITEESNYDSPIQTIDENNVSEEIDDLFIEEDDEIEIGEMI
jgi:peptidoglycan hydrolase CwlO-like protein